MAAESSWPGEHCKNANICEESLLAVDDRAFPKLTEPLTKGIVLELSIFRKKHDVSWIAFYNWLGRMSTVGLPSLPTLKALISRVEKKRSKLSRNKQHLKRQSLLNEPISSGTAVARKKVSNELMLYGLWQCESDISQGLAKLQSKSSKLKALKVQLAFRKKVLEQQHPDKEVFLFSKNKRQLTVKEVSQNLIKLITPPSQPLIPSPAQQANEMLIGRRIRHRWKDSDGSEQWYLGRVLSLVPGTDNWFNVRYDGEEEVLSLNLLLDVDQGDLEFID